MRACSSDGYSRLARSGAILRSSYFFGVDGLLLAGKESAPATEAVARISCGALDLMAAGSRVGVISGPVHEFVAALGAKGWRTVATGVVPDTATASLASLGERRPGAPRGTIIVLGNEARGVRPEILAACQECVVISGGAPAGHRDAAGRLLLDSLNVSAAAAVLLAHVRPRGGGTS